MHWSRRIAEILLMLALPVLVAPAISFAQPVIWAGGNGPWFSASVELVRHCRWLSGCNSATQRTRGHGEHRNIFWRWTDHRNSDLKRISKSSRGRRARQRRSRRPDRKLSGVHPNRRNDGRGFSGSGTSTLAISNRGVVTSNFAFIGASLDRAGAYQ